MFNYYPKDFAKKNEKCGIYLIIGGHSNDEKVQGCSLWEL